MVFTESDLVPTLFRWGGELMPFKLLVSTGIDYLSIFFFFFFFFFLFKHILLPNYLQQWGWVTSSHNISFDPSPTFYIYTIAYKHGYIYKRIC